MVQELPSIKVLPSYTYLTWLIKVECLNHFSYVIKTMFFGIFLIVFIKEEV
jgi:hypothetical protein